MPLNDKVDLVTVKWPRSLKELVKLEVGWFTDDQLQEYADKLRFEVLRLGGELEDGAYMFDGMGEPLPDAVAAGRRLSLVTIKANLELRCEQVARMQSTRAAPLTPEQVERRRKAVMHSETMLAQAKSSEAREQRLAEENRMKSEMGRMVYGSAVVMAKLVMTLAERCNVPAELTVIAADLMARTAEVEQAVIEKDTAPIRAAFKHVRHLTRSGAINSMRFVPRLEEAVEAAKWIGQHQHREGFVWEFSVTPKGTRVGVRCDQCGVRVDVTDYTREKK